MKKFYSLLAIAITLTLSALSQEAPLETYLGKYNFPEGSPVPYTEVKLNGAGLITESPMGIATLQRIEADMFAIVEYNGLAEFRRNSEGKVIGVKVSVMGIELEGTKEEVKLKAIPFHPLSPMRLK
ncbi:MAG TPA: DUF3471 domain-containing protein [Phnomibacter sp.]|nr:DUF3471 domain-containing protein [Phnomibacter sp.]